MDSSVKDACWLPDHFLRAIALLLACGKRQKVSLRIEYVHRSVSEISTKYLRVNERLCYLQYATRAYRMRGNIVNQVRFNCTRLAEKNVYAVILCQMIPAYPPQRIAVIRTRSLQRVAEKIGKNKFACTINLNRRQKRREYLAQYVKLSAHRNLKVLGSHA